MTPSPKWDRTHTHIQLVALELFTHQGYSATTTAQIAAVAEVSQMTLFRHFPTKESLILQDPFDPAIAEAAVLGVPDPVWGEIGIAVCVPRPGATAVEAEVAEFLGAKIPRYKMPKRILFWEALPKSGYGKVPKRLVRDELERRGELPGAKAKAS